MTKRDRMMLLVIAAVALLGGFWMLVISPQRKAAADAEQQVQAAQTALDAARQKAETGKAAQTAYQRDRAAIVKIGRVVPETDDIPTLVAQLQHLAEVEGVAFTTWSLVDASGGSAPGAAGSSDTSSASSGGTSPGVGKQGNGSTDVVRPLYPPGSVQMDGGLGRTPVKIGIRGTYFKLERYLRAVQRFAVLSQKRERSVGRLVVVDGFTYQPAGERVTYINGKKRSSGKTVYLDAELDASVYFAPPMDTPSASGGAAAAPSTAASSSSSTTTGAATVGGIK